MNKHNWKKKYVKKVLHFFARFTFIIEVIRTTYKRIKKFIAKHYTYFIAGLVIFLLFFPMILYALIINDFGGHESFTSFSKEIWFSFMGSYIPTIIFSGLALFQNQRYKKLSDRISSLTMLPEVFLRNIQYVNKFESYYCKFPDIPNGVPLTMFEFDFITMNQTITNLSLGQCSYKYFIDNKLNYKCDPLTLEHCCKTLPSYIPTDKNFKITIAFDFPKDSFPYANSKLEIAILLIYHNQYSMACEKQFILEVDAPNRITNKNLYFSSKHNQAKFQNFPE